MATKFIPVCEPMLAGNELKYVTEAVSTGWISSAGKYVTEFERQFARYCGCEYGVAVCNGTVALHLALVALGIGPGDEVIIPSFTMIATAFAVCYTGAIPVFVDADPDTWNIDVRRIEEKITDRTKAILPVHLFGMMCDMDANAITFMWLKMRQKVMELSIKVVRQDPARIWRVSASLPIRMSLLGKEAWWSLIIVNYMTACVTTKTCVSH